MEHAAGLEEGEIVHIFSLNWEGLKPWDCGLWSETEPPLELRGSLHQSQRYLQAIHIINMVHKKVLFRSDTAQTRLTAVMVTAATLATILAGLMMMDSTIRPVTIVNTVVTLILIYTQILTFRKQLNQRILLLLQKAVGEANSVLWEEDLLISWVSNGELLLVCVPLRACREHLGHKFDSVLGKCSCAYVCCLAQRHVDSALPPEEPGHLQGGPCFCQFVHTKTWCCCYCV